MNHMEVKMKKNSYPLLLLLLILILTVAAGCSFNESNKNDTSKTTA